MQIYVKGNLEFKKKIEMMHLSLFLKALQGYQFIIRNELIIAEEAENQWRRQQLLASPPRVPILLSILHTTLSVTFTYTQGVTSNVG